MRTVGKQSWVRFSLRSAFLLLTALCICLGLIVGRAREQRQAVIALTKVGAEIRYDCDTRAAETISRIDGFIDPNYLHSVVWVTLSDPKVTDESMGYLKAFPQIRSLVIYDGANVTSDGLKHLGKCPQLKNMILTSRLIDDRGMAHLAAVRQLEELWLVDLPITDAGLKDLAALAKLRDLRIWNSNASDEAVIILQSHLPNCKIDSSTVNRPISN